MIIAQRSTAAATKGVIDFESCERGE